MSFEAQNFKFSRPFVKNLAPKSEKSPKKAPKVKKINFLVPKFE